MLNVNSSLDEIADSMVISIISNTQMENPGRLLMKGKGRKSRLLIDLIKYICIFLCLFESFHFFNKSSSGIVFLLLLVGIAISPVIFFKAFKKDITRCRCNLEVYENGIKGRGITKGLSGEWLSEIEYGKKVIYSVDFHENYIEITEGLDNVVEDTVRFYYLSKRIKIEDALEQIRRSNLDSYLETDTTNESC